MVKKEDEKILQIVLDALEDNKAEDVISIDLQGKTSIASYMVVASGTSQRHVASTAERVQEKLKAAGIRVKLNYSATPYNLQDAQAVYQFAKDENPLQFVTGL